MSATPAAIFQPGSLPAQNPNTLGYAPLNAPQFEPLFSVVAGSWKVKDNTKTRVVEGGPAGNSLFVEGRDPGYMIDCEIILGQNSASPPVPTAPIRPMAAVAPYAATGSPPVYIVLEATQEEIGTGFALRQKLKLFIASSLTPSQS